MRGVLPMFLVAVGFVVLACDANPQDKTAEKSERAIRQEMADKKTAEKSGPANSQVTAAKKTAEKKYVNSKQIALSYDLKGVGRSGVSSIELWWYCEHDRVFLSPVPPPSVAFPGFNPPPAALAPPTPQVKMPARTWNKLTEYPLEGKAAGPMKLDFELSEEGMYGITLVTKNGIGIGGNPPAAGDAPQVFVVVDLTAPVVAIKKLTVGTGAEKGKLFVEWTANDVNMAPNPIRLSWAEKKDGKWTTFAEKIENTGMHIWQMPEDNLPPQLYLKIEAIDLAGNVGQAITNDALKVDLSVPTAIILDVTPSGR